MKYQWALFSLFYFNQFKVSISKIYDFFTLIIHGQHLLEISLVQKVYHSNGSNYFYAIMDFHDVVVVKPYNIGVPLHDRFSLSKFSNYICNFVHSTKEFACWFLDNIRKLHIKEDYMFNQFYSPLKKYKNWNRKYRKKRTIRYI